MGVVKTRGHHTCFRMEARLYLILFYHDVLQQDKKPEQASNNKKMPKMPELI